MKLFLALFLLFLVSCATNKPNYVSKESALDQARVTIYWPRQWQSQWGKFQIFMNGKLVKTLKNEGYLETFVKPGEIEINSRHFQNDKFVVIIKLVAKASHNYFLKLDTQPEEVTLMSAFNDISAVGSIVAGMKSEVRLKEGRGSWTDVKNLIDKEKAKAEMEAKKKELGYHVLIPMDEQVAVAELKACCNSEEVE